jgi:hypothetical protein
VADDLNSLYLEQGPTRLKRELDTWLQANLRPPVAAMTPRQSYEAMVDELAPQYGQDPTLVKAMIQTESNWSPNAVSPAGAQGIAQFMPATAKRYGVSDPFDPAQAIPGMLRYLRDLTNEFGDPTLVVAAYNAGEGAVRQHKGIPPYDETINYVRKVFGGAEPQRYTSRGQGAGPTTSPAETQRLTQDVQTAMAAPPPMPPAPPVTMLDTALPTLTPEAIDAEKQRAYTSLGAGEGLGPTTFPEPRRFRPDLPGGYLESGLEEPTWQRVAPRVMQGTFGTLAVVANLPITAGRLLGIPEREAEQLFPQASALRNSFRDMATTFDPTGTEENIVDRFAQTLGQQVVFFGSGALVGTAAEAIGQFAPAIGRALGATTAAVQEAGMEAQETMDRLTPLLGEKVAAQRANTVFWRNVGVLALTNKLGVFGGQGPTLLKLSTAATMEGFQEVVQYDVQRREFWVPASHPLADELRQQGWQQQGDRVAQPFAIQDAAEAGAIGAILGPAAHVVVNGAGQQVLPVATEQQIRQGLDTLAQATGAVRASQEAGAQVVPATQPAPPQPRQETEQAKLQGIRERIAGMDDSQVRDDEGRLIRMYHGTATAFDQFDLTRADTEGLYGPGLYFTDAPSVASGYAKPSRSAYRLEDAQKVFQPGTVVDNSMGGRDLVLEFRPNLNGVDWSVVVQGVDVQGQPLRGERPRVHTTAPEIREANVRPAYLDIKHPFDLDSGDLTNAEIEAIQAAAQAHGMTRDLSSTSPTTIYNDLVMGLDNDKATVNAVLQQAGFDGIAHTGGGITGTEPHQVYIAFSPEQVIPAFELEAHPWFQSVLAYADRPTSEADTAPVETGAVGYSVLGGQRGGLSFNRNPFPRQPSPPPKRAAPTLQAGATGLEPGNFRDEHGRWRLLLREMPSTELELQDFIRQQGGIRLAGEELQGELRALISRKETGLGGLQNDNGLSLQAMAQKASELGFTTSPDKTALLAELDRSINQGHLVYSDQSTGHIPLVQDPILAGIYQDVVNVAETLQENITEQRRGTRPRAQVHAAAAEQIEQGMFTLDDVRDLLPGTALNDEMASTLVQYLGRMAGDVADVARAYVQSGQEPASGSQQEQAFLTAFALLGGVQPQRLGAIAEAGRSLGILNDPLSATNQMLNQLVQLLPQSVGMDSRKLAEKYLTLYDRAGGAEAVKYGQKALTPGLGGMLWELFYQGMLSNPKTWLTNEVSNATVAGYALPVRLMSGLISQYVPQVQTPAISLGPLQVRSLNLGGSGEVGLMETAAYAYGLQHMMQRAWQMSAEAFKTGQGQFGKDIPGIMEPIGQGKAVGPALTSANLQANGMPIDPNSPFGKLADFWFDYIGISLLPPGLPTGGRLGAKIMTSRDEWYKFLNYGGELAALAYRKAAQEQTLDPNASFAENMARILREPLPEEMHQAAASHGLIQTFQNELTGRLGQMASGVQQFSIDVPGFGEFNLGRIVVPFLHVAVNIPRYALENSPAGLFFRSVRDDLVAGGARGDLAQGKMLMGTLTTATFALMASSGLITGRGPEDKDLRAALVRAGWQPYSAYVPWLGKHGGYVSLRSLDPIVGQHAGIMADIVESWNEQRLDWYERMILGPIFAVVSNLGTRSYMRGMAGFFDALAPRSMREFEGEGAMEGLRGFIRGEIGALTPAVWSVAEKAYDPATKAAWGMLEGARAKVPGWADGLPNYRNKWGDKRLLGWGWAPDWLNWVEGFTEAVNPLKVSTLVSNPLDRELIANQIRLAMPTRSFGMRAPTDAPAGDPYAAAEAADPMAAKPIPLNPAQYERYVALAANNLDAISELGLSVNEQAVRQLRLTVGGFASARLPADVPSDLYSVLLWATTTNAYQEGNAGPDGDKEHLLRQIDRAYRQFGRAQLLANDPDLRDRYLTGQALHTLQRTPVSQRERMRGMQERSLREQEERLRVGAPR